jgi:hypothetical protein
METNEAELRELAKRRVQAKVGLAIHVGMYVVVNAGLIAIWAFTGAPYPWFIWPLLGWGVGVLAHVAGFLFGPGSVGEDRAIARELRRQQPRAH